MDSERLMRFREAKEMKPVRGVSMSAMRRNAIETTGGRTRGPPSYNSLHARECSAMSSSSFGKHASGATSGQSAVPEPSFAEKARTLIHSCRIGSLSTLSRKQQGFPFGSLMPYALDAKGRPVFLISTMAMHTQNLLADPRASLFVTEPGASGDPLGSSRVTLIGTVSKIPEPELAAARPVYLAGYPDSKYWVDFDDFSFYRMDVLDVYYV